MRLLVSYTRSIFWTIGIIEILAGLLLTVDMAVRQPKSPRPVITAAVLIAFGLVSVGMGVLFCFAARALRHQKRFAKPLVAISSIFSLVLFPFGTVAGAVGLYWCCSGRMRTAEPLGEHFEHQSKPGDGTNAWVQKLLPVVSIAVWLASLGIANRWGKAHGLPQHGALNGLLLIMLCEWISVFCHELGHAAAGWAVDMRLAHFAVGPFVANKKAGKWKFQFSLLSVLSAGGGVATTPTHLRDLRRRMAFEIAGGPVASFVTALAAFLLLLAMPGSAWEAWWNVPAVIAAISAGAAILNLIPFGFAAGYSDGALLLQLLLGGPFADLREALKMVGSTTVTSTRPRDLDAHALADGLRAGVGTPEEGTLQMIQLICAVDRGDLTEAREHLESSLRRIPAPVKAPDAGCAAEMAFYMAYLDGNAGRAGEWLRGAEELALAKKTSLSGDSDYWRALTAVRKGEGLSNQADAAYRQAMELLAKKPAVGLYQFEQELLQTVRKGEWLRRPNAALSEVSI